jgi:hypothetical protein
MIHLFSLYTASSFKIRGNNQFSKASPIILELLIQKYFVLYVHYLSIFSLNLHSLCIFSKVALKRYIAFNSVTQFRHSLVCIS